MNLIDLLHRQDKSLRTEGNYAIKQATWIGEGWRVIEPDGDPFHAMTILGFDRSHAFRMRTADLGWYVCAPEKPATFTIALQSAQGSLFQSSMTLDMNPVPVRIDWPVGKSIFRPVDLRLEMSGKVRIYIHKILDRKVLYRLAVGTGVEIGPGPKPQILSSADTSVSYLEELSKEEWLKIDTKGKFGARDADWSRYINGKASSMPVENNSLDFIFSSHVFEHLVNPLGHLRHWQTKLRNGGKIIAIVPDLASCKDYPAEPSGLAELEDELHQDIWEPQRRHYERFLKYRAAPHLLDKYMSEHISFHVHFYTRENIPSVLEYAVTDLGFKSFDLKFERNHKDFYYILYN